MEPTMEQLEIAMKYVDFLIEHDIFDIVSDFEFKAQMAILKKLQDKYGRRQGKSLYDKIHICIRITKAKD
jgi:hypothetical protein